MGLTGIDSIGNDL